MSGEVDDGGRCVPEACGVGPFGGRTGQWYVLPGSTGDGSESSPFGTVEEGVARGGTVVLGEGTYAVGWEALEDDLHLVGRCRDLVVLDGETVRPHLVRPEKQVAIDVSEVTVRGYTSYPFWLEKGAATLDRVRVEGSAGGIYASRTGEVVAAAFDTADLIAEAGRVAAAIEVDTGGLVRCTDCVLSDAVGVGAFAPGGDLILESVVVENVVSVDGVAVGLEAFELGTVVATDLVIRDLEGEGIYVHGSSVAVTGGDIGGIGFGREAWGVGAEGVDAEMSLVDVVIHDVASAAVFVTGGVTTLTRVTVRDVVPGDSAGAYGYGLYAAGGATVSASAMDVERATGAGVCASDADTEVRFSDGVVSDVRANPDSAAGVGALAQFGGSLVLERSVVSGPATYGIFTGPDSVVLAEAVSVDGLGDPDAPVLAGVQGGRMTLRDVDLTNGGGAGIHVTGGRLEGEGVAISRVSTNAAGEGAGIQVDTGGTLQIADLVVADVPSRGLIVTGEGSAAVVSDGSISGVFPAGLVPYTSVIEMTEGGSAEVSGMELLASGIYGIVAHAGFLTITDSILSGTRADGVTAIGLALTQASVATLERVVVEEVDDVAVLVSGPGSALTALELTVASVHRSASLPAAVGLIVQDGATVELTELVVGGVDGPGVASWVGGHLFLRDPAIADVRFAGIVVGDAALDLQGGVIGGVGADVSFGGGVGIWVSGAAGGATAVLRDGRVEQAPYAALWFDGGGPHAVEGMDLAGGDGVDLGGLLVHGNAVYVRDADVSLVDTRLHDSRVAVLLHDAGTTLVDDVWSGNSVDLVSQACGERQSEGVDDVPVAEVCPSSDRLTVDLLFDLALIEVSAE